MDIQKMLDSMSAISADERSKYHLTLGGLIDALDAADQAGVVRFDHGSGVGEEDSYRGYYSDLSFSSGGIGTVGKLNKRCKAALGSTYEGYKGGDYTMTATTPLWNASYGNCGLAIIGAQQVGGELILTTKNVD